MLLSLGTPPEFGGDIQQNKAFVTPFSCEGRLRRAVPAFTKWQAEAEQMAQHPMDSTADAMSLETLKTYLDEIRKAAPGLDASEHYETGRRDLQTPNAGKYPLFHRLKMKTEHLGGPGYGIDFSIPFAIAMARNGFDRSAERDYPAYGYLDEAEQQAAEILSFSCCAEYQRIYVGQRMDYFEMGLILNDQYKEYCVDRPKAFPRSILDIPDEGKTAYFATNAACIVLEAIYKDHGRL